MQNGICAESLSVKAVTLMSYATIVSQKKIRGASMLYASGSCHESFSDAYRSNCYRYFTDRHEVEVESVYVEAGLSLKCGI